MNFVTVSRVPPRVHSLRGLRARLSYIVTGGFWALAVGTCRESRSIAKSLSSGLESRHLQGYVLGIYLPVRFFEDYIGQGPTAWIRCGVEADYETANSYRFFLSESVCIVYDRPGYPRVKRVSAPVNRFCGCALL